MILYNHYMPEKDQPDDIIFLEWAQTYFTKRVIVEKEAYGNDSRVYKLTTEDVSCFLKIGRGLKEEKQKLEWLDSKTIAPKVLGFLANVNEEALLLTSIHGKNLAKFVDEWQPEEIVISLATAISTFHEISPENYPFCKPNSENVLIHGDACLPNFIFDRKGNFGYVDLRDMRIGEIEVDLAAAIWSLDYELGNGWGPLFLSKYGYKDTSTAKSTKLKQQYENFRKRRSK